MLRENDEIYWDMEGRMNEHWTYQAGWHRGFAAGFACAAVVSLGVVFVLLAFDTFDKPVQTTQVNKFKDKK